MSSYRISEVGKRTGFSAPTLRYYERIGLIPAPERTPGGYRSYDDEHLQILDFVGRAKSLGLHLGEIRSLVEIWASRDCRATRAQLLAQVDEQLTRVRAAINDLSKLRVQLEDVYTILTATPAPTRCGPGCGCEIDVSRMNLGLSRELNLISLKSRAQAR